VSSCALSPLEKSSSCVGILSHGGPVWTSCIFFSFFFIALLGCIELPHLSRIANKAHRQDGRVHGSYHFTWSKGYAVGAVPSTRSYRSRRDRVGGSDGARGATGADQLEPKYLMQTRNDTHLFLPWVDIQNPPSEPSHSFPPLLKHGALL
jgi:hypothetical protein